MNKREKAKHVKAQIRENARMAKLLLPSEPSNSLKYSNAYFESYSPKLFEACRNSRHRHCPKTASHDSGRKNFYCICPCHLPKMSRHKRRQMWLKLKKEHAKKSRKQREPRAPRDPNAPRAAVGTRGQKKVFRYVKAPTEKIPAGIMHIVHAAIAEKKEGTVTEIAAIAIANGLEKVTGQDPTTQTSIMLHRMLKAGVVEVV